jgi:hypothetical protein
LGAQDETPKNKGFLHTRSLLGISFLFFNLKKGRPPEPRQYSAANKQHKKNCGEV